jgi:hypothetical protein
MLDQSHMMSLMVADQEVTNDAAPQFPMLAARLVPFRCYFRGFYRVAR